jgi:hypothetical protein
MMPGISATSSKAAPATTVSPIVISRFMSTRGAFWM